MNVGEARGLSVRNAGMKVPQTSFPLDSKYANNAGELSKLKSPDCGVRPLILGLSAGIRMHGCEKLHMFLIVVYAGYSRSADSFGERGTRDSRQLFKNL